MATLKRDHTRLVKANAAHTEQTKKNRILKAEAKQKYEASLLEKYDHKDNNNNGVTYAAYAICV